MAIYIYAAILSVVTLLQWSRTSLSTARKTSNSITNELISLWSSGDLADSDIPIDDGTATPLTLNGTTTNASWKKVLQFLNRKAALAGDKKIPSAALEGLNALVSGTARTPKPINLELETPFQAAMTYFRQLGINEKNCQLRTVCELLTEPQASYGIFGELINYVFGKQEPDNDSRSAMDDATYREFFLSAQNGRRMNDCAAVYNACKTSYKEYIKLVNV